MTNEPTNPTPMVSNRREIGDKFGEMLARLPHVTGNGYYRAPAEPEPESATNPAEKLVQAALDAGDVKFARALGDEFGVDVPTPPTPASVDLGARAGGTEMPSIEQRIAAAEAAGDHKAARALDVQKIAAHLYERYEA